MYMCWYRDNKTSATQKMIAKALKPLTTEASPENNVRKIRPSPFNKKSEQVLSVVRAFICALRAVSVIALGIGAVSLS